MGNDNRGTGFFTGLMLFKAGFIVGGIIGAAAAYILSQKSTREMLKAKVKDAITQVRENIREAIEEGREAAVRREAELRGDQEK
jgi:gas vesicle protein